MDRAGSHETPPSMDRANQVSEKKLAEFSKPLPDACSLGATIRCHVAYTRSAFPGSAVRVSLSLKLLPSARGLSKRTSRGALHVAPSLSEKAVRIAFRGVELSNPIAIACSRPAGP